MTPGARVASAAPALLLERAGLVSLRLAAGSLVPFGAFQ
jgi:hypothetical protein